MKSVTSYTTYVVSTPEKVWEALTSSEYTKTYFFGRTIESDWKNGSPVKYFQSNGTLDISGKILECNKPNFLSFTWKVESIEELKKLPECIVQFSLKQSNDIVRLTMKELHHESVEEKYLDGGRKGWPIILSGLKTLLETGKPMSEDAVALTQLN
jgi:uncharacterized protein YndB with AHSA1/START domain